MTTLDKRTTSCGSCSLSGVVILREPRRGGGDREVIPGPSSKGDTSGGGEFMGKGSDRGGGGIIGESDAMSRASWKVVIGSPIGVGGTGTSEGLLFVGRGLLSSKPEGGGGIGSEGGDVDGALNIRNRRPKNLDCRALEAGENCDSDEDEGVMDIGEGAVRARLGGGGRGTFGGG